MGTSTVRSPASRQEVVTAASAASSGVYQPVPMPALSGARRPMATDIFQRSGVRPGSKGVPLALRLMEIVVALMMLILSAPIMAIVALIIKLTTPGPVLFRQRRVGINGKLFTFVKFRTLYADARQRWPELYEYRYSPQEVETLKFKQEVDPRVTPQGKWLRKSTLDELPNLWNVLTGDMALVGPRPEIPEMLPYYRGEMLRKFTVRPGVTGLAQVSGRGRLRFYETAKLDVEYVKQRNFWYDTRIMLSTLKKMLRQDGAF